MGRKNRFENTAGGYTLLMERFYDLWTTSYEVEGTTEQWKYYLFRQLWLNGSVCAFLPEGIEDRAPGPYFAPFAPSKWYGNFTPAEIRIVNEKNLPGYPEGDVQVATGYTDGKAAVMYAMPSHKPMRRLFDYYAKRVMEVQESIDQHLEQVILPYVVATSDEKAELRRQINAAIENKDPFIALTTEQAALFRPQNIQANYLIDKLEAYKNDWMNEALNIMGIDSSAFEKKERLLTDEVNANNAVINLSQKVFDQQFQAFAKDLEKIGARVTFTNTVEKAQAVAEAERMAKQPEPNRNKEDENA